MALLIILSANIPQKVDIFAVHQKNIIFTPIIKKNNRRMKRYAIGVDIGGTNTVVGMVDAHGEYVGRIRWR